MLTPYHEELLASAGSRWDDWRPFPVSWFDTPVAADFKERAKLLLRQEFGSSPLFAMKDPRVCRFAGFWLQVFAEEGVEAKVVIPVRSPLEVAQSHRTRDQFPVQKGLLLWLRHVLDAEAASRNLPRSIFEWSAFLKDWRSVTARTAADLGAPWPALTDFTATEIDCFLSTDLQHERFSDTELAAHPGLHGWVTGTYAALQNLASDPASVEATQNLDRIRTAFTDASQLFGGALAAIEVAQAKLASEAARLEASETALRRMVAEREAAQAENARSKQELDRALVDLRVAQMAAAKSIAEREGQVDALRNEARIVAENARAENARLQRELDRALLDLRVAEVLTAKNIAELEGQVDALRDAARIGEEKAHAAELRAQTLEAKIARLRRQPIRSVLRWAGGYGV